MSRRRASDGKETALLRHLALLVFNYNHYQSHICEIRKVMDSTTFSIQSRPTYQASRSKALGKTVRFVFRSIFSSRSTILFLSPLSVIRPSTSQPSNSMDSFSSEHDHCCQPAPATSSNSQERVRHVSKKLPQIPEEETARFPTSSQAYQEQRQVSSHTALLFFLSIITSGCSSADLDPIS